MTREPLRPLVIAAARRLADAGVPSPDVDAQELAAFVLGVPRTRLGLTPLVDGDVAERYAALVDRRADRVPLQHLLGVAALANAVLEVGPGVFVPRPETESLVEWGVRALAEVPSPLVVDLCAGSGAIALAVAAARPDATVIAVERSASALAWARRNIDASAAGPLVQLRAGDVLDPRVLADLDGRVDLVTANPPYVPEGTTVPPEVARFDPPESVFAGVDGLDVIRPLLSVAAGLLRPGGWFAVEHDDSHAESVPALLRGRAVFADVLDHPDLAGRPRFATARRVPIGG